MSAEVPQTGGGEGPAPVLEASTVVEEKLNPEAKDAQSQSAAAEVPESSNHVEVAASASTEPVSPQSAISNGQQDWEQKEAQLLQKIQQLEGLTKDAVVDKLKTELKVREEEVELLKARVTSLETELQAALAKPGAGKNQEVIDTIKKQHEELLTKARGMIFDKTKMVKNQELQIEALNTQVQSLKDINQITKDLLEIRNAEMKAMEDRLSAMEARFKAEKERHALVLKRTEASSNINGDLKKEYETQLALFKELRVKYDERVQALVAENTRLKELKEAKEEASG